MDIIEKFEMSLAYAILNIIYVYHKQFPLNVLDSWNEK